MSPQFTNRKILVVDDDADFASDLKMWLSREGFSVHVAQVGRAAIQFHRLYRPYTAVLLDLHMPKMDGFEVLKDIKSTDVGTRVAVLTADATTRSRANALGADAFLVKPINRRAICGLMQQLATTTLS
ncbi:MAG: response regulator [Planctomycetes bacterium]|nr:response regulator [Planctomycetota bacterium]MBL7185874.1 response regulator [Phycisphaerae bacterium]